MQSFDYETPQNSILTREKFMAAIASGDNLALDFHQTASQIIFNEMVEVIADAFHGTGNKKQLEIILGKYSPGNLHRRRAEDSTKTDLRIASKG